MLDLRRLRKIASLFRPQSHLKAAPAKQRTTLIKRSRVILALLPRGMCDSVYLYSNAHFAAHKDKETSSLSSASEYPSDQAIGANVAAGYQFRFSQPD